MRNRVTTLALALLVLAAAIMLAYCNKQGNNANQPGTTGDTTNAATTANANPQDMAHRGAYLVTLAGCNDCHTPKIWGPNGPSLDTTKLLSGFQATEKLPTLPSNCLSMQGWVAACDANLSAWTGPWGISYAANLTPDTTTGLGGWDEATFVQTLRTGKHMGTGRNILPPMPWQEFSQATDGDLSAIWAYLRTLKPVTNEVPQPVEPTGGPGGAPAGGAGGSTGSH